MKILNFFLLVVLSQCVSQLNAQSPFERNVYRHERIRENRRGGEIDRSERHYLRHENNKLKFAKGNARKDGKISRQEARRIHKMENRLDRDIYCAKHNRRNR
ncbi:MAG: hypothetical protein ABI851_09460 [Saprospiraceae bacterium]